MVNGSEPITDKLFGDVCQPFAVALFLLCCGESLTLADFVEHIPCTIRDPAGELAVLVVVVRSADFVRSGVIDTSHFQRLGIVEGRMTAAMMNNDRMLGRHLIKVMPIEWAIIFDLGVVEEVSLNPKTRRCFLGLSAQFVDNAGNSDELHFIRISDKDFVEQNVSFRMVVTVNESGNHRHLLRIKSVSSFSDKCPGFVRAAHKNESTVLHSKGLRLWHACIHGVDIGIEHHQVRMARIGISTFLCGNGACSKDIEACQACDTSSGKAQKFSTILAVPVHPDLTLRQAIFLSLSEFANPKTRSLLNHSLSVNVIQQSIQGTFSRARISFSNRIQSSGLWRSH